MNKTVIFITYSVLATIGLIGSVIVLLMAPNQFGSFTGYLIVLLGLVTTTAVTIWGLNKAKAQIEEVQNETGVKLDVVQRQTNGTLSRLIDKNDEKTLIIHSKDNEITRLAAENAELRVRLGLPPMDAVKGKQLNE